MVRAEKGALLVVPVDDPEAVPQRAVLDRDGLVAGTDGERHVPTVGDLVQLDDPDPQTPDDPGVERRVRTLVPRRTALVRDTAGATSRVQVLAANVDVVLVVEHLDPDPALGRVERLLTLAWRSGARPVVVLTKADLVPDPLGMAEEVAASAPGADVHVVSATDGAGIDALRALLRPGLTFVVVGPSGAGKSTLVNALAGREVMETGERRTDGRGRHTTTHRELVPLGDGALLIDTPGVRGVGLVADGEALDDAFSDVAELARSCRFGDCRHAGEPGCAVAEAVTSGELSPRRLDSWRRLAREAAHQARRADARLAAADRAEARRRTRQHHRDVRDPGRQRG